MTASTWDDKNNRDLSINLLNPKHRHYTKNIRIHRNLGYLEHMKAIEKEIVNCQKSVLTGEPGELDAEVEFYERKYPWIKFYRSKDNFLPNPFGISITNNPELSKISRDAYSLIETGIWARLTKEKHERINFSGERAGIYQPTKDNTMTMEGCISTFFILCGGVAIVAILVFGAEIRKKIQKWISTYMAGKMRSFCKKRSKSKPFVKE